MSSLDGPLRNAANNGDRDRVRQLLQDGADPDAPNKNGVTALQLAIGNQHHDVVAVLVDAGANPFQRVGQVLSPIAMASSSGDAVTLRTLLRTNCRPGFGDLENALGWAVVSANIECIDTLLEHGAEVGAADPTTGRTALDHARWWYDEAHPESKPRYQRVVDHLQPYFT